MKLSTKNLKWNIEITFGYAPTLLYLLSIGSSPIFISTLDHDFDLYTTRLTRYASRIGQPFLEREREFVFEGDWKEPQNIMLHQP